MLILAETPDGAIVQSGDKFLPPMDIKEAIRIVTPPASEFTRISSINQKAALKSLAPYNVPISPDGPSIMGETPDGTIIFDGWQMLPPIKMDPEKALEQAFSRCICIQRQQIRNRVTFYDKLERRVTLLKYILDPFKMRKEEEEKQERLARKSLEEDDLDSSED